MQTTQTQTSRPKAVRLVTKYVTVKFPASGGVQVDPDTRTVLRRQAVIWEISCENPKVREVQVEFQNHTRHHFFPDEPEKHTKKQEVSNTTLRGKCPDYPHLDKKEEAKYTVRGLGKSGKLVRGTKLDPVIITPRP